MLALAVSAQTYLSMLGHGHSFGRILLWQLGSWSFWAAVSPLVVRRGAALLASHRSPWRHAAEIVGLAAILMAGHGVVASQLTIWLQPLLPVESHTFVGAFISQLPARFVVDLLAYGLLLVGGAALASYRRAASLELRESRLEAELVRAELHALRLEIAPHFLFNTLNSIAALIRIKDNGRALEMLVGLSEFMRSNLDHPREPFAALSAEIDWVRRYVGLQQTRFGDRLAVDYEIDAACVDVSVPTLMLQPIVENALRHGAARQTRRCRVVIGAARDGQRLRIRVADDGAGLPPHFHLDRQAGTGLKNIRARLDHLYGRSATLDVRPGENGEPAGTVVEIVLPLTGATAEERATA